MVISVRLDDLKKNVMPLCLWNYIGDYKYISRASVEE